MHDITDLPAWERLFNEKMPPDVLTNLIDR